jgi:hypothetical protein
MALPTILTVNPMRRRHKRAESAHRRRRSHTKRASSPRRYRRRIARAHNPRRRLHARRMPNPLSTDGVMSLAVPAGIGAASAVGLDVALAYLPLPTMVQTGWGNILLKMAAAIGLGFGVGHFTSRRTGAAVAGGALTVYGYEAIKMALAPTLGTSIKGLSGLADFSDFQSVGIGAYMPGAGGQPMGAYMTPAALLRAPAAPAAAPAASLRAKQVAGLGRMGAWRTA